MYYLCKTGKYSFYSKVLNLLQEFVIPTKEGTVLIYQMSFLGFERSSLLRRDDSFKDNNIHSISVKTQSKVSVEDFYQLKT